MTMRGWGRLTEAIRTFLILACLAMSGCAADQDQDSVERNKATVARFVSAFSVPSDEEAMAIVEEVVTEDFFFDDPPLPEPVKGVEGAKKWVSAERAAFKQLTQKIELMVGEQDHVMAQVSVQGVYQGDNFMGLDGAPREIKPQLVLAVYHFSGGRIAKIVERYDSLHILQQMGVIPSMEEIQRLQAGCAETKAETK